MTAPTVNAPVVVPVTELERIRRFDAGSFVVVDGLSTDVPLPVLARMVAMRRLVRAGGGDLVLAASETTALTLRRAGLWMLLATEPSIEAAAAALRQTTAAD